MNWPIYTASHIIKSGGIIAYPTEAVWGIGCDPFNDHALEQILQIKQRDADKGLLLIADHEAQLEFLLHSVEPAQLTVMKKSWQADEPVTWLIPHRGRVPAIIHGQFDTVAVRVSHHPVVKKLCQTLGGPIVSTSANLSGHPAATNIMQVRKFLGDRLDYILPGPLGGFTKPSRIIDAATGRVIRP